MPDGARQRYEQLSPKSYEHPADRAATSALHSIPLMDKVVKRLTDVGHERRLRQVLVGNAVEISERQVPALWAAYAGCSTSLDLVSTPPLFITQTPFANALTIGARRPMVILYSGLPASYEPDEVEAILAHELGHVLSEHYYYTTALVLLSQFLRTSVPGPLAGLPVRALYLALLEWSRAAELSSDRASALVVGDPLVVCRTLMRLAGGAVEGMDLDAFIAQAVAYEEEEDLFARWSRAWVEIALTHPFAVRRVRELVRWVEAGEFDRIRGGSYLRRGNEPPPSKEFQAAVTHYRTRFANMLERTTGGVQRLARQLEDWLRGTDGEDDDGDPIDDDAAATA
ncbi:MAG TPA: M48 family metallopeptidase [Acidimicrobiales bacterium]|jgi:Zn-dependent protease with chaperone function|nr:M48 family metallopeptidase [Acidimicrobiales bacterium]